MEFIKKNYLIIIFAVLIIVIIGLTVRIIHFSPVVITTSNIEREYLLKKIHDDSLLMIDISENYQRFKDIAESKPKEIVVIKTKYIHIKDSVISLPLNEKIKTLTVYLEE